MAYDEKYRIRAVEYRKEGHTIEQTCKTFKIGSTTLKTWVKKHEKTGEIKDKPLNRTHKKIDPVKLEAYMEKYPDAYLDEIAKEFKCWPNAVSKALKKQGITRKKRPNASKSKILKR